MTFFAGAQLSETAGVTKSAYLVIGVASSVLAASGGLQVNRRMRSREEIRFEAALAAVADHMGMLATQPDEAAALLGVIDDRLTTVVAKHAGPDARCAFYALESQGRYLKKEAMSGVPDDAPPGFGDGDKDGRALLHAIHQGDIVVVPDNRNANGNLSISLGGDYQTAVVAPVFAGDQPQGVLIIDAPKAGDLAKVRESFVRVFARLIGTSHAVGHHPATGPTAGPALGAQPGGGRPGAEASPAQRRQAEGDGVQRLGDS
ncbi:GAF domain-containing protein [Streptomyces sp. NPDC092296]|uniref:GAF domain-containing protein n=1 Tax=Streptomyces sp. NPDC092296 TaxID=3366012 RepID=UPI0037FDC8BB